MLTWMINILFSEAKSNDIRTATVADDKRKGTISSRSKLLQEARKQREQDYEVVSRLQTVLCLKA